MSAAYMLLWADWWHLTVTIRDREVGGSNPLAPTIQIKHERAAYAARSRLMWGLLCGSSFEAAQPFRRSPLHFGIRQVIEKSSEINGIILRRRLFGGADNGGALDSLAFAQSADRKPS